MALFRVDFSGRGELADRQQRLGQVRGLSINVAIKLFKYMCEQKPLYSTLQKAKTHTWCGR